jgi:hypothetical protein
VAVLLGVLIGWTVVRLLGGESPTSTVTRTAVVVLDTAGSTASSLGGFS